MSNVKCYFCGSDMIWGADFNYDEIHGDGEGVVSTFTCSNQLCEADAEFSLRTDKENE